MRNWLQLRIFILTFALPVVVLLLDERSFEKDICTALMGSNKVEKVMKDPNSGFAIFASSEVSLNLNELS